jgi:hypothetical protein
MGTRLVAGRDFTWADLYDLRPRVTESETFARESWGSASASIGKRLRQFDNSPWQEVVGVVEDVRVHGVDEKTPPIVYWPAMLNNPYPPKPTIDAPRSSRSRFAATVPKPKASSSRFTSGTVVTEETLINPNFPNYGMDGMDSVLPSTVQALLASTATAMVSSSRSPDATIGRSGIAFSHG